MISVLCDCFPFFVCPFSLIFTALLFCSDFSFCSGLSFLSYRPFLLHFYLCLHTSFRTYSPHPAHSLHTPVCCLTSSFLLFSLAPSPASTLSSSGLQEFSTVLPVGVGPQDESWPVDRDTWSCAHMSCFVPGVGVVCK